MGTISCCEILKQPAIEYHQRMLTEWKSAHGRLLWSGHQERMEENSWPRNC